MKKNIPIPKLPGRKGAYNFKDIKVDDSFYIEGITQGKVVLNAFRNYINFHSKGWKIKSRTIDNGIRIWRVK